MVCPRCFEELGIKTQMKIEGGFMRCILCKHKALKGQDYANRTTNASAGHPPGPLGT